MKASPIVNESTAFVNFKRQVRALIGQEKCTIVFCADFDKLLFTASVRTKENVFAIYGNGKSLSGKWKGRVFKINA